MANLMPKRRLENIGLGITGFCVALVALVVVTLIFMVAQQGLSTFFVDGMDPIGPTVARIRPKLRQRKSLRAKIRILPQSESRDTPPPEGREPSLGSSGRRGPDRVKP